MTEPIHPPRTSPKATGVLSEAIVLAELSKLGYAVSIPFGDNQRYDFIVDDGQELTRVQVKTGRLRSGSVVFPTRSTNWHSREQRGYHGEADDFVVYCPETDAIYRLPVDRCGTSGSATLRVNPPSKTGGHTVVWWARDHVVASTARPMSEEPLKSCAVIHPDEPPRIVKRIRASGVERRVCQECQRVYNRRYDDRWRGRVAEARAREALASQLPIGTSRDDHSQG